MLTDLFAETFIYERTNGGLSIVPDPERTVERLIGGKTILENSKEAMGGRDSLVHYWERFFLHFCWSLVRVAATKVDARSERNQISAVFCNGSLCGWP
jgi:hypothetical protein